MIRKLARDPYVWLATLFFVAPLVLYAWPVLPAPIVAMWSGHLADPAFLILTVVTLLRSRRDTGHPEERFFWRLVLGTCALWLAGSLCSLLLTLRVANHNYSNFVDLFYLGSYVTLILAADLRPHLPAGWSHRSSGFRFSVTASMLFVAMLAFYFFALPFLRASGSVGKLSVETTFVALDLVLTLRFLHLMIGTRRTPWSPIYAWLALSNLAASAADSLNIAWATGSLSMTFGTSLDAVWWLPFFTVIVARRWRTHQVDNLAPAAAPLEDEPRTDAIELILLYAFSFPAAHLLLEAGQFLPANTHVIRQLVVLVSLIAFATLALLQQRVLARRHRELRSQIRVLVTNEQVVQSQKLEAIGRLAGGLAHDFNNLLTVVGTRADVLLSALPYGESGWRNADAIRQSVDRGAALTRQLLAFSRSQVLKTRSLDLNAAVNEAQTVLSRLAGERFTLDSELQPKLPPIESEPSQVFQVLLNLVANARDAMPAGGRIVIRTYQLELAANDPAFTPPTRGGLFAALEVIDTGTGIDDETQRRIFEPFFSSKFGGTGLGLAVVYGIVAQAGGHVRVRSDLGRGTSFSALFPFSDRPVSLGEAPRTVAPAPDPAQRVVLLVEDQDMVRHSICELLMYLGYQVKAASSGDEALAVCRDKANTIDILLTDVIMPGMRGPEVAERVRALRPKITVVYMSGFAENDSDIDIRNDPSAHFIGKPFTLQTLRVTLNELLAARPATVPKGDSKR